MKLRTCLLATLVLVAGCSNGGDEVARVGSPDGRKEGVVIEKGGGATTSYWYDVCVVNTGQECDERTVRVVLYDASRNLQAYGVNLEWIGSARLVVKYDSAARVERKLIPTGLSDSVRVDLRDGVIDPTAPPGSMGRSLVRDTSE